jgi:hypothetical protein
MVEQSKVNKAICKVAYKGKTLGEKYGLYIGFIFGFLTIMHSLYIIYYPVNCLSPILNIDVVIWGVSGGLFITITYLMEIFICSPSPLVQKCLKCFATVFFICSLPLSIYLFGSMIIEQPIIVICLIIFAIAEILCLAHLEKIISNCPKFQIK